MPRKLVILSACQTGVESTTDGEGMAGLARTFLAANVPLVVASGWKVDTLATTKLMSRFHNLRMASKQSSALALRNAQIEMMKDASGKFNKPYFWAGFAAYGGYTEF